MSTSAEQLLGQLHRVLEDLEEFAGTARDAGAEGAGAVTDHLKEALGKARERISGLETGLKRGAVAGAKATDAYVRDHTWQSIGVAAAIAFLLGALLTRRN
jgi:ElaB/YqjD/DUF883 family membrane-anchored ribosome-binding protein